MANKLWCAQQQAFRQILKQTRLTAELTQKELAARLNKPQSYVSKYESGERKLDYLEVREICCHCNSSILQLEKILIAKLDKELKPQL